jgi:hypothetical protein
LAAAKEQDPSSAQLLRYFIRHVVKQQRETTEHDAWFRREGQIGIDAANASQLVSSEEIEAEAASRRAATRYKMAGADL